MNPNETIKSLIPEHIFSDIPAEKHAHVKAKIVRQVRLDRPELFEAVGEAETLSAELAQQLAEAIAEAYATARRHHDEMVLKMQGDHV